MTTYITKDANNANVEFDFDGDGTTSTPFIPRSRSLLGATNETAPSSFSGTSGLNGLLRALWTAFGTQAEASSSTGSLMARIRLLLTDTIGAVADVASATGSLMARQRLVAQAYSSPNVFVRWGTSNTDTVSGTPAKVTKIYVYNKSANIRYLQLFNRATNPTTGTVPLSSHVLAPNEKYNLAVSDFGSNDGLSFSTGLAWGFSTTEATFTAGASADVSTEILWRSL